jgi:phage-related minor tail protein
MLRAAQHALTDGEIVMREEHDNMVVTFQETATLICQWFTDPAVAQMQIALLRNLLRRGREKYILKQGSIQPRKRDLEAFRHKQLMPLAGNLARIQQFVQNHHANKSLREAREINGAFLAQPPVNALAQPQVNAEQPLAQPPVNAGQAVAQDNDSDGKSHTHILLSTCSDCLLTEDSKLEKRLQKEKELVAVLQQRLQLLQQISALESAQAQPQAVLHAMS